MFGRVLKNAAPFWVTRPNISEPHSEISTRVPFCIAQAIKKRRASSRMQDDAAFRARVQALYEAAGSELGATGGWDTEEIGWPYEGNAATCDIEEVDRSNFTVAEFRARPAPNPPPALCGACSFKCHR